MWILAEGCTVINLSAMENIRVSKAPSGYAVIANSPAGLGYTIATFETESQAIDVLIQILDKLDEVVP